MLRMNADLEGCYPSPPMALTFSSICIILHIVLFYPAYSNVIAGTVRVASTFSDDVISS